MLNDHEIRSRSQMIELSIYILFIGKN